METITITGMLDGQLKELTLPILPTPLAKLVSVKDHFLEGIDTEAGINALTTALFHGIRRAGGQVSLEWIQENVDALNQDADLSEVHRG
jgi:hypothetical protein